MEEVLEKKETRGRKKVEVKSQQYGYYMKPHLKEILSELMATMGTHVGAYLEDRLGLEEIYQERKRLGLCKD